MTVEIQIRQDRKRRSGWRKPGGKYLIAGGPCLPCGKLPKILYVCPTCGHGVTPMRGWRWIDAQRVFGVGHCGAGNIGREDFCDDCTLHDPPERAGLLWIGACFYTPEEFLAEASTLGISRRIGCVPKGFEAGKTLVLLAARHVSQYGTNDALFADLPTRHAPAIFAAFIPRAIEYVVKGTETEEELERLVKQGCTLVKVERVYPDGGSESACGELPPAGPADLRTPEPGRGADRAGEGGGLSEPVCEVSPAARERAGDQDKGPAAAAAGRTDGV